MVAAATVGPDSPQVQDVLAVGQARQAASWMIATLDAVASAPSLRTAATTLPLHHSSLQERTVHAQRLPGTSATRQAGSGCSWVSCSGVCIAHLAGKTLVTRRAPKPENRQPGPAGRVNVSAKAPLAEPERPGFTRPA